MDRREVPPPIEPPAWKPLERSYHLITLNGIQLPLKQWPLIRAHDEQRVIRQLVGVCGKSLPMVQWFAVYAFPTESGSMAFSMHMAGHEPTPQPLVQPASLLTVDDVAQHLGKSKWCIYELVRQGKLHAVKIGRTLRFRPEDVQRITQA